MPTEFCQKCKQSHPGRSCDYDDQGECAETVDESNNQTSKGTAGVPARSAPIRKSNEG